MEFLEERYPEPPLLPPDPADRAAVRLLIFRDDDLTDPYYAFRRGEDGAREQFDAVLGRFDALLGEQPYLERCGVRARGHRPRARGSCARATCSASSSTGFPPSPTGSRGSSSGPRSQPKSGVVAAL